MQPTTTYRQLDAAKTIETIQTLRDRISERFEESSLASVSRELCTLAGESRSKIAWIERPHLGLRAAVIGVVLLCLVLIGFGIEQLLKARTEALGIGDSIALLESAINEIIIAGAALAFLFSLELRAKRTRALQTLHEDWLNYAEQSLAVCDARGTERVAAAVLAATTN